jgi:hypothetical protein
MQLSVKDRDCVRYEVYLDGQPIKDAVFADEEAGLVLRRRRNLPPGPDAGLHWKGIPVYEARGKVELRRIA